MRTVLPLLLLVLLLPTAARGEERLPPKLEGVTVVEKLGQTVPLDTPMVDHQGKRVRLRDFFQPGKPVMLTLNYYRCATLCSVQLNQLVRALRPFEWTAGKEFRQITLSIDHRETPDLARAKRNAYLLSLGRGEVDWTFLVAKEADIRRVADAVGFGFRYDADQDQWAHPAVVIALSPEGKVSRYLYGLEYAPRDLKFALLEASEGRAGSTMDRLILSCFHYNADEGRYGPYAFGIMRLSGAATVVVLGVFLALFWRRERGRDRGPPGAHPPEPSPEPAAGA